jgi:hypothetical protein
MNPGAGLIRQAQVLQRQAKCMCIACLRMSYTYRNSFETGQSGSIEQRDIAREGCANSNQKLHSNKNYLRRLPKPVCLLPAALSGPA